MFSDHSRDSVYTYSWFQQKEKLQADPGEIEVKRLSILLLVILAVSADSHAQNTRTYKYIADLHGKALKQGTVVASGIRWSCSGSRCTVTGPWPTPGVMACRALGEQVGRIKSYGHSTARLDAAELNECNSNVAASDSPFINNKAIEDSVRKVPPIKEKEYTPGPIRGPDAETLPSVPTAILRNAQASLVRTDRGNWRCDGTRCRMAKPPENITVRSALNLCTNLAQTAGVVTWFTDGRKPFDAEQLARCNSPIVQRIEVLACSGGDDLRRNSTFKIGINVSGRDFTLDKYRTLFRHLASDNCKTAAIGDLLYPSHRLSDLRALHFRFESGKTTHVDSSDNWDMNRITVTVWMTEPGGRQQSERIVDLSGSPVKRFGHNTFWRVDINP